MYIYRYIYIYTYLYNMLRWRISLPFSTWAWNKAETNFGLLPCSHWGKDGWLVPPWAQSILTKQDQFCDFNMFPLPYSPGEPFFLHPGAPIGAGKVYNLHGGSDFFVHQVGVSGVSFRAVGLFKTLALFFFGFPLEIDSLRYWLFL